MTDHPADQKTPAEAASLPWLSARQLGVIILLCSMSVLFVATIIGFWFTRLNAPHVRAPGLPDLPGGLALSTLLIVLTSFCIWQAQLGIKKNLLDGVYMSAHDRRQAEHDLHKAEQLVDFIFAGTAGWQGLVRRLRGLRLAH